MFIIDIRTLIWMECCTIRRNRSEKGVIRIKHLSCQNLIPFPSETASVNSLFPLKSYIKSTILDFFSSAETERAERIEKDHVSSNVKRDRTTGLTLSFSIVNFAIEVITLIVKLEDFRIVSQHFEGAAHETGLHVNEVIENLAMFFGESEEKRFDLFCFRGIDSFSGGASIDMIARNEEGFDHRK